MALTISPRDVELGKGVGLTQKPKWLLVSPGDRYRRAGARVIGSLRSDVGVVAEEELVVGGLWAMQGMKQRQRLTTDF